MIHSLKKSHYPIAVICTAFAVLIAVLLSHNDVVVKSGDPIDLMTQAQDLSNYHSKFWPPLYATAMAALEMIIGNTFRAGQIISMLSGVALVLLTYALGIRCFRSREVALIGSILVALSPVVIKHCYVVGTDMMAASLFLGSTYVIAGAQSRGRSAIILAGVLAGLAYMTRYVYAGLLPAGMLYLALVGQSRVRDRMINLLYFCLSFIVVIAPWTIICLVKYGDLHNMNHINIAFEMLDTTNSWLWWDEYERRYPTLVSLISAHPSDIVRYFAKNAFHFPAQIILRHGFLAGAVALLGSVAALRRPSAERLPLVLNGLAMLFLVLMVKIDPRLYVWLFPIILLYGAYVMTNIIEESVSHYLYDSDNRRTWLSRIPIRNIVIAASLLIALVFCIYRVPLDFANNNIDDEKRAGEFILKSTPNDATIMTSSPNLAWYAERQYVHMWVLEDLAPTELEDKVAATNADFFAYSKRHSTYSHPQLAFLLDPNDDLVPDSWHLIYRTQDQWPVVVYKIED